jgi:hypothetical protein
MSYHSNTGVSPTYSYSSGGGQSYVGQYYSPPPAFRPQLFKSLIMANQNSLTSDKVFFYLAFYF